MGGFLSLDEDGDTGGDGEKEEASASG